MKTEMTMTIEEANAFLNEVKELETALRSEVETAEALGLAPVEFRQKRALAMRTRHNAMIIEAKELRDGGMSLADIASHLGFDNESSVQELLAMDKPECPPHDYIKTEMSRASNLITNMVIKGANVDEMERALAYVTAVTVIYGHKLGIDYIRQSAESNGIAALEAKYQRASG